LFACCGCYGFRWEQQKFFCGAIWVLLDLVSGYTALALCNDFPAAEWLAVVPISITAWVEVIALATLCVAYFPRLPYQLAASSLIVIVFALFTARTLIGSAVIGIIDRGAPSL